MKTRCEPGSTGVVRRQQQLSGAASCSCSTNISPSAAPAAEEARSAGGRSRTQPGCHRRARRRRTPAYPPALAPRRPEGQVPSGRGAVSAREAEAKPGKAAGSTEEPFGPGQRSASPRPGARAAVGPPRTSPWQPRHPTPPIPPLCLRPTGGGAAGWARALPLTCARQGLAPSGPLPQSSCCSRTPGSPRRRPLPRASSR